MQYIARALALLALLSVTATGCGKKESSDDGDSGSANPPGGETVLIGADFEVREEQLSLTSGPNMITLAEATGYVVGANCSVNDHALIISGNQVYSTESVLCAGTLKITSVKVQFNDARISLTLDQAPVNYGNTAMGASQIGNLLVVVVIHGNDLDKGGLSVTRKKKKVATTFATQESHLCFQELTVTESSIDSSFIISMPISPDQAPVNFNPLSETITPSAHASIVYAGLSSSTISPKVTWQVNLGSDAPDGEYTAQVMLLERTLNLTCSANVTFTVSTTLAP